MIERLRREHQGAIQAILEQDPVVNLFLLGLLDQAPMDRTWWYGAVERGEVRGVALLLPERLCVPWAPDPEDARRLGLHLAGLHAPTMMVGPRADVDAIWQVWGRDTPVLSRFDQRLYVLRPPFLAPPEPGLRRARPDEWPLIARWSAEMELEDLGRDPRGDDPALHDQVVQERLRAGRTWVVEDDDGELVFQVNVGTSTPIGCQVGGTWVPRPRRRQGWAKRGMRALGARLLQEHPLVTLHVNEANLPAVRVYEAAGFRRAAPLRLITLQEGP